MTWSTTEERASRSWSCNIVERGNIRGGARTIEETGRGGGHIYQSHAVSHETQGEGLTRRGVEGEHVERTRAGDDCEGAEGVTCLRQGSQNCPARSRDLDRVSLAQF